MEQSFVILKPDAVERNLIGEIIKRFEGRGLKVIKLEMTTADDATLAIHYPLSDRNYLLTLGHVDITGKSEEELETIYNKNYKIVSDLQKYLKRSPIVKMILEAEGAVALVREDLGIDSFEKSDLDGRAVENLIHASGNVDEAKAEIALWFPS